MKAGEDNPYKYFTDEIFRDYVLCFTYYDKDGDGYLNKQEYLDFLSALIVSDNPSLKTNNLKHNKDESNFYLNDLVNEIKGDKISLFEFVDNIGEKFKDNDYSYIDKFKVKLNELFGDESLRKSLIDEFDKILGDETSKSELLKEIKCENESDIDSWIKEFMDNLKSNNKNSIDEFIKNIVKLS